MDVCIAYMREKPVILSLNDSVVAIDGEVVAINGLTEGDLQAFAQSLASIECGSNVEGYKAMLNAKRAAFIVNLLGLAVGDDCVSKITNILDSVHYEVLVYLGEVDDA